MGCSTSKLDDEEAVQLCRDRRNFIKQAVEHRNRFAAGHITYIRSLTRVSQALRNFVEGDEHHDFFSDSYMTPPFTPVKRLSPEISSVPVKSFSSSPNSSNRTTVHVMKYLRSGGNASISVEEWPRSAQNMRIDSYYPIDYEVDYFFVPQASPLNTSFFSSPSPQTSQWDFWNPFSALDTHRYASRYSPDQITSDDEMNEIRCSREEEEGGIPELEEEEDSERKREEEFKKVELKEKRSDINLKQPTNVDKKDSPDNNLKTKPMHEVKESVQVSQACNAPELKNSNEVHVVENGASGEETPAFTVYVNRRPSSMAEVMKDIESQFVRICDCAQEIAVMLEANRVQSSPTSELAVKMLNPIALIRSGSSRSFSSRFVLPSSSRDEGSESCSEYSEESCMVFGSHQSTLDRLYAWEKKLYKEVKNGERIRIEYDKKCMQLRSQDMNGDEPSAVDRTRAAIRDLHTQLAVSIHSVEAISRRIEMLRDEELHPQLIELIQGLARMWRTMADCHGIQKRTIDEAKRLLSSSSSSSSSIMVPANPSRAAAVLESELRGWRAAFESWAGAQRAYARALAGWIRRCAGPSAAAASGASPLLNPCRFSLGGGGAPPVYGVCVRWSRFLELVNEKKVVDGLDFFVTGITSVTSSGGVGGKEAVEGPSEAAERVVWAGTSAVVGALADFAASAAEGYEALEKAGAT